MMTFKKNLTKIKKFKKIKIIFKNFKNILSFDPGARNVTNT